MYLGVRLTLGSSIINGLQSQISNLSGWVMRDTGAGSAILLSVGTVPNIQFVDQGNGTAERVL